MQVKGIRGGLVDQGGYQALGMVEASRFENSLDGVRRHRSPMEWFPAEFANFPDHLSCNSRRSACKQRVSSQPST